VFSLDFIGKKRRYFFQYFFANKSTKLSNLSKLLVGGKVLIKNDSRKTTFTFLSRSKRSNNQELNPEPLRPESPLQIQSSTSVYRHPRIAKSFDSKPVKLFKFQCSGIFQ